MSGDGIPEMSFPLRHRQPNHPPHQLAMEAADGRAHLVGRHPGDERWWIAIVPGVGQGEPMGVDAMVFEGDEQPAEQGGSGSGAGGHHRHRPQGVTSPDFEALAGGTPGHDVGLGAVEHGA